MSSMKIFVNVSAKQAALNGSGVYGEKIPLMVVLDELTDKQRQTLSEIVDANGVTRENFPSADHQGLLTVLGCLEAAKEEKEKLLLGRIEAAKEHAKTALETGVTLANHQSWLYPHPENYHYTHFEDYRKAYDTFPGIKEARENQMKTAKESREAEIAQTKAKEEVEKRERAEKEEKKRNDLLKWAMANGSERLRHLIQLGFAWEKIAVSEFFEVTKPEGFVDVNSLPGEEFDIIDRLYPTIEELRLLVELKKLCESSPDVFENPQIEFVKGNGEDQGKYEYPVLSVRIYAPNRSFQDFFKKI